MNFTQADLDQARTDGEAKAKTESEAALATATSNFTAAQAALGKLEKERQTERIDAQIKGWKEMCVILPADEPGLRQYMASLEDAGQEFTFSKAEGGEAKKTPAQFFADFMASRKPVIKLGGIGAGNEPADAVDLTSTADITAAANNFIASEATAGRVISAAAAVQHVTSKSGK